MTDDETELAIRSSPALWLETCGKIEDKEKNLVSPTLNVFQRRMSAAYEWQREQGVPCRQVDLKPRRVGGTTMGAAITYHHERNFACNGIMIADTHGKSEALLKMYQRFAQNDGFDWQQTDSFGIRSIQLGASKLDRLSAEAPKGSRGLTLMALHSSEVAFWPSTAAKSADETNAALRIALAKHPQTSDIEESTPKGASGIFFTLWQDARWPQYDDYWKKWGVTADEGDGNGYIRVFAAWYEFADYALPVHSEEEADSILASLTAREKRGIKLYEWTVEQIKWRRFAIKAECLNDERRFDEEYPEDPISCFLSSGSPRFDSEGLTRLEVRAQSVGVEHGLLSLNDDTVTFKRTSQNESVCSVWEPARVGCSYLISIDPNAGKIVEGSTERDNTSVQVWRAPYVAHIGGKNEPVRIRLVARLRAPWQAENTPTARFIDMLSRLYGRCIVIPENNVNSGLIDALKKLEVPLYLEEKFDMISSKTTRTVGWCTTNDTRPLIIDALADVIRDQRVDIGCGHLVSELRTFVRTKTGRFEAASGRHDDDVMGAGIAVYNIASATKFTERPRKRQRPPDADQWKVVK